MNYGTMERTWYISEQWDEKKGERKKGEYEMGATQEHEGKGKVWWRDC